MQFFKDSTLAYKTTKFMQNDVCNFRQKHELRYLKKFAM